MSGSIFISHTEGDHAVANAIATLVDDLFGSRISVNYSSKKQLEGGPAPGQDWFHWIIDQVKKTDIAIILLTPSSIQKPWVIWEAGAVAGASFASTAESQRLIPMVFGLRINELPEFFARTQTVIGTDESEMTKLMDVFFTHFMKDGLSAQKKFFAEQPIAIGRYVTTIREVLLTLPHQITEASIQEWLGRLDELDTDGRYSEALVLEDWMNVAFGRDEEDRQRPIDLRIHRRLGELYASARDVKGAARQFELANRLAPRDIFILRRLGKAYLDANDLEGADRSVKRIATLDEKALERNVENAALAARLHRARKDLPGACEILKNAFNANPTSYYLGDLLGQVLVAMGDVDGAKNVYARVHAVLSQLHEQNIWTLATSLSAAFVRSEDVNAILDRLREQQPTGEQIATIERGIAELAANLGRDTIILGALHAIKVADAS